MWNAAHKQIAERNDERIAPLRHSRIKPRCGRYAARTIDPPRVIFAQGSLNGKASEQRRKNGGILDGEAGPLPEVRRYRMGCIPQQPDLASGERGHWIEIENVGPDQRIRRRAIEHLRDRLMEVRKDVLDTLQIELLQGRIISPFGAATGKPVDSLAWQGGETESLARPQLSVRRARFMSPGTYGAIARQHV